MSRDRKIGAYVKIACDTLHDVKTLGPTRRSSANLLFQAIENIVLCVLEIENENIDKSKRYKVRHHNLDAFIDLLPDECVFKTRLKTLEVVASYATTYRYPTDGGRIPQSPTIEELKTWENTANEIIQEIIYHCDIDINNHKPVARIINPIRDDSGLSV